MEITARPVPRAAYAAKVDVYDIRSGQRLWGRALPSKGGFVSGAGRAQRLRAPEPYIRLLRWSPDGHCLSFTIWHKSSQRTEVSVIDTSTWQEVLFIGNAMNAFVVPGVRPEGKAAGN